MKFSQNDPTVAGRVEWSDYIMERTEASRLAAGCSNSQFGFAVTTFTLICGPRAVKAQLPTLIFLIVRNGLTRIGSRLY
jgi:hypothetical protein